MVRQLPRVMMNLLWLLRGLSMLVTLTVVVTIRAQVLNLVKRILPLPKFVQPVKTTLQDIQRLKRAAQIRLGHVHRYIGHIRVASAPKRPRVTLQVAQAHPFRARSNHIVVIIAQLADPAGEATRKQFVEFAGGGTVGDGIR
uniref:(northern house mosquito) hypothetical protein n=1 Tax=Culex pipiens TaxID=7175 RepID=A0A8D8BIA6_CULPI